MNIIIFQEVISMKKLVTGLAAGALVISILAACGEVDDDPTGAPLEEPGMEDQGTLE